MVTYIYMDDKRYFAEPGSFNRVNFALDRSGHIHVYRTPHRTTDSFGHTVQIPKSQKKSSVSLETFQGVPLADLSDRTDISAREIVLIMDAICSDVQGNIHGDLKTINVLVAAGDDGTQDVTVIDWDNKKAWNRENPDNMDEAVKAVGLPGTSFPGYQDDAFFQDPTSQSDIEKIDVFAMGCMLLSLLGDKTHNPTLINKNRHALLMCACMHMQLPDLINNIKKHNKCSLNRLHQLIQIQVIRTFSKLVSN